MRETKVDANGVMDPNGQWTVPTPCVQHGGHDCDCPRCDKCGADITTGMMAAICAGKRECAFWPHEPELDEFMRSLRDDMAPPSTAPTRSTP